MSYKIASNELGSAVGNILLQYTADVQAGVIQLTDETAEKLKKYIQNGAPVDWRRVKRRGKYRRSWRAKTTQDTFAVYEKTVYAGGGEYRLTHLLEKGHRTRSGGKTKAQAHIAPAAERITKEYVKGISEIVRRSSQSGGGQRKYKR